MTAWPWRTAVRCQRESCRRPYPEHEAGGGPCEATGCPGFRWIDPQPAADESRYRSS